MDERSFENTLKVINVIIEQLLKFQERMQKKDLSELRIIAEGIFFNIDDAFIMDRETLIIEIVKARAKMLEPKKHKKNR